MNWPLPQDFNEAIQNSKTAFTDPDLKAGNVVAGPTGVPMPRSGNFADVYQIRGADGREWAVKCFTRPVEGLDARYAAVDAYLSKANLPFTVGFSYLKEGIRVRGKTYPCLKMQWVEGENLNQFVRENTGRATILENMLNLWVRLCRRLRETGMAHCDLQHGNVILVPGTSKSSLGLKLVDYDGMFVPDLANQPTGELGHSAYQHPERAARHVYSADLDRFPHLVVATALRGLMVGGKPLWDRYDNGDNLLFTEKDFKAPYRSKLIRELWESGDPFTMTLVSHLVIACARPLSQAPWLDLLMPEGRPSALTPSQERQAAEILGLVPRMPGGYAPPPGAMPPGMIPPGAMPPGMMPGMPIPPGTGMMPAAPPAPVEKAPPPPQPGPALVDEPDPESEGDSQELPGPGSLKKRRIKASIGAPQMVAAAVAALVVLGGGAGIAFMLSGGKDKTQASAKADDETPKPQDPPAETPKPPVVPPKGNEPVNTPAPKSLLKATWASAPDAAAARAIRSLSVAADGSLIGLTLEGKPPTAKTFDPAKGQALASFTDHQTDVVVAVSAGGKCHTLGSNEPFILTWNGKDGKRIGRSQAPMIDARRMTVGSAGKWALIESLAEAVVVDLEAGGSLDGLPPLAARAVGMNAEGTHLLILDGAGAKYTIWDLTAKKAMGGGMLPAAGEWNVLAWSADEKFAAIMRVNAEGAEGLHVIDLGAEGKTVSLPEDAAAHPVAASFTSDGKYLAVVGGDEKTRAARLAVYAAPTWTKYTGLPMNVASSGVYAIPKSKTILVSSFDKRIRAYELGESTEVVGAPPTTMTPEASPSLPTTDLKFTWQKPITGLAGFGMMAARPSVDGSMVYALVVKNDAAQPMDKIVIAYSAATGDEKFRVTLPPSLYTSIIPTQDRSLIVAFAKDQDSSEIRVYDGMTGTMTGQVMPVDSRLDTAGPAKIGVSADGRYLAAQSIKQGMATVRVFDLKDRKELGEVNKMMPTVGISIVDVGTEKAVLVARPNEVETFKLPGLQSLAKAKLPIMPGQNAVVQAISADGKSVIRTRFNVVEKKHTYFYAEVDSDTEKELGQSTNPRAAFLSDGKAFLSETPTSFMIADVKTGKVITRYKSPDPLNFIHLTQDGTQLTAFAQNRVALARLGGAAPDGDLVRIPRTWQRKQGDPGFTVPVALALADDGTGYAVTPTALDVVGPDGTPLTAIKVTGTLDAVFNRADGSVILKLHDAKHEWFRAYDPKSGEPMGPEIDIAPAGPALSEVGATSDGAIVWAFKAPVLRAWTSANGQKAWEQTTLPVNRMISAVTSFGTGRVLVQAGSTLDLLDATTGQIEKTMPIDGTSTLKGADAIAGLAALDSIEGGTRTLQMFNVMSSKVVWTRPGMVGGPAPLVIGTTNGTVVVEGAKLVVVDPVTGKPFAGETLTKPAVRLVSAPKGGSVAIIEEQSSADVFKIPTKPAPVTVAMTPVKPMGPAKQALPTDAELAAAIKDVRETFKAKYASKMAKERHDLAEELLTLADKTMNDPKSQYALYKEVIDFGVELKDPTLIVRAGESVGQKFVGDPFSLVVPALEKSASGPATVATARPLADICEEQAEVAAEAEQYEAAVKLLVAGSNLLKRVNLASSAVSLDARLAQLRKVRARHTKVQEALAILKTMPEDAEANTTVGRFRCFVQGQWDAGFKNLAAGKDPALKDLAAQELQAAMKMEVDTKIADAWLDLAKKAPATDEDKRGYELRARWWYAKAVAAEPPGLRQTQLLNKLAFTQANVEYKPGLVVEWFARLPQPGRKVRSRVDSTIDFSAAEIFAERLVNRGTQVEVRWTGSILPPQPGRYRLTLATTGATIVKIDGKNYFDVKAADITRNTPLVREVAVVFGDRPAPIVVDWATQAVDTSKIKLSWTPPGTTTEELIPIDWFYRDRKAELLLK